MKSILWLLLLNASLTALLCWLWPSVGSVAIVAIVAICIRNWWQYRADK